MSLALHLGRYLANALEKRSEKEYDQLSEHNFGRYTEANIEPKAPLWQPEG